MLDKTAIPPENIIFEFTETALARQMMILSKFMHPISKLGIRLMLDDFCNGPMLLSSVKNLPLYGFKVSKVFVDEMKAQENDGSVLKAIISLAKNLGLHCSTGNIETSDQYTFLRETSCDEGQGYLLSKPLPLKDLLDFMHAST